MNQKKTLLLALCLLLSVNCIFGLAEDAPVAESCNHSYSNRTITDSTCSAQGLQESYCTSCGMVSETSPIPMKSHSNKNETIYATCQEEGVVRTFCSICGYVSYSDALQKVSHLYTRYEVIYWPPCTSPGLAHNYCKWCDAYQEIEIVSTGHSYPEVSSSTEADCTTNGITEYSCSRCGVLLSRSVSTEALGHNPSKYYINDFSCAIDRQWSIKCSRCFIEFEKGLDKAPGHVLSRDLEVSRPATCMYEGTGFRKCSTCGLNFSESIPVIAHIPGEYTVETYATCKGDPDILVQRCTSCNTKLASKNSTSPSSNMFHTGKQSLFEDENGTFYSVCSDCGTKWLISNPPVPTPAPPTPAPTSTGQNATPIPTSTEKSEQPLLPQAGEVTTGIDAGSSYAAPPSISYQEGIVLTNDPIDRVFVDNEFLDIYLLRQDESDAYLIFTQSIIHTKEDVRLNLALEDETLRNMDIFFRVESLIKLINLGITHITVQGSDSSFDISLQAVLEALANAGVPAEDLQVKIIFTVNDGIASLNLLDEMGQVTLMVPYTLLTAF